MRAFATNYEMEKRNKIPKKYSAIGLRIKERMKENGLSQKELGMAAGVTQPAISQMISSEVPSKYLPKLAIPLKSPYEWLAFGRGPRASIAEASPIAPRICTSSASPQEEAADILKVILSASSEAQKIIARWIKNGAIDHAHVDDEERNSKKKTKE